MQMQTDGSMILTINDHSIKKFSIPYEANKSGFYGFLPQIKAEVESPPP